MVSKTKKPNPRFSIRRVFVIVLILLCSLVTIALLLPLVIRPRAHRNGQTETINNARQIGLALLEFKGDYGYFPNNVTNSKVSSNHTEHRYDLSGTTSNALFRQLFAADIIQSEQLFRIRMPGVNRPDDITTRGEALKKGECGFSYITGLSSKNDPATPIVMAPLIPGTTKFDPEPFDGKAVVLFIDCSVRSYPIRVDGHIYDKGINLLSPKHPVWKGKAPDIRYPEL